MKERLQSHQGHVCRGRTASCRVRPELRGEDPDSSLEEHRVGGGRHSRPTQTPPRDPDTITQERVSGY